MASRVLHDPAAEPIDLDFAILRARLLDWYDRHRRDLPWRAAPGGTVDPWAVLVSEIMLQQTTVATVRGRFEPFLARFPTIATLAQAPLDDVLHAWQGLGYYRRARALHAAANAVVELHGGALPADPLALRELPGLGDYTAAAVAAIAFDLPVVPVDGNGERVLARLVALDGTAAANKRSVRQVAQCLAGRARAGDLAQALIELGALVCTPARPRCLVCPWRASCRAATAGDPERYPAAAIRKERPRCTATAFLLTRADGAVLFRRRSEIGLLAGLIELPSSPWPNVATVADELSFAPARTDWLPVGGTVVHLFTHLALELRILRGMVAAPEPPGIWAGPSQFGELALPTLTVKLLRHAGYTIRR